MSTPPVDHAALSRRRARLESLWRGPTPVVMGVLNCTPDSFSDGGRFATLDDAVSHAGAMAAAGAGIVDVGGESTRPGASSVSARAEHDRVVPVIAEIRRRHPDLVLSVDTSKVTVAEAALAAGADVVNDVTGGRDPAMLVLVAAHGAAAVLMHMRGTPETMQTQTRYGHVVAEVHGALAECARNARCAGVAPDSIWLDPGIGFGKSLEGNLRLLGALGGLASLGHPVLIGTSRKRFIGELTDAAVDNRLPGTLASLIPAVGLERAVVRVHDPGPVRQFLTVARAVTEVRA